MRQVLVTYYTDDPDPNQLVPFDIVANGTMTSHGPTERCDDVDNYKRFKTVFQVEDDRFDSFCELVNYSQFMLAVAHDE